MSKNMSEEEMEREDEEYHEVIKLLLMAIQAIVQVLNALMVIIHDDHIERPLARRPISRTGYDYINKVLNEDPQEFRVLYRMYPDVFLKLCDVLTEKTHLKGTRFICIEEMVATFLLTIGQNSRYCQTRDTFRRSHFTTSKNFNNVLKALNTIAPDLMVQPGSTVPTKIRESTRFYPYFKDCVGAIDGTHIPAMVSGPEVASYRDRHGKISQNVLAACNFDLEFIYILSGWEGSAHDSKLLHDVVSRRNGLKVPKGKFFLVHCGFANCRQFLAPFRGVRYHLQDFAGNDRDPVNANELFNLQHASLRNIVERIFGVFKSRFTIFKSAPPFPIKTQAELVLACAGLHNFLRKECRSDEFPIEQEDDESEDEENDDELGNQTQEQQRQIANAWRAGIATNMWTDAMSDSIQR